MPSLIAAQVMWKSPRCESVRELGRFAMMMLIAALGYFGTLNLPLFQTAVIPTTGLDNTIPFVPAFIVSYLSFLLLIVFPLFVMRRPQERRDAAFGFALIVVGSSLAFLFWPTIALTTKNACPSLPVALAIYCTLCAQRHLKTAYARFGLWMWTLAVVVSPLLIKRDVVIDIAAGAAFGVLVHTALFFRPRVEPADSVAVLETFRIRNRLAQDVAQSLTELRRYNGRKRIAEFAAFLVLGVLGLSLSIWARSVQSTAVLLAGILVTSVSLNAFPLLMHEGIHGVLFPNRRWNWFVSVLLGATFLMSFTAYRVMHFRHHRYLGDPRNPDDYRDHERSRTMVWFRHFARLTFGPLLYVFMMPYLGLEYGSRAQRKLIGAEYAMLFVIYSVMLRAFPVRELFIVWFVPLLVMGMFAAIRGFSQHALTDDSDPYLGSRTMVSNPTLAFILLQENYHVEHHLFPEVPSYHLPHLHQLIWPKLPRAVSGGSYLAFLGKFFRATARREDAPIGVVTPGGHSS